jgi:hypothetical protein
MLLTLLCAALASDIVVPRPPRMVETPAVQRAHVGDAEAVPGAAGDDLPDRHAQVRFDVLEVHTDATARFPASVRDVDAHDCAMRVWIDAQGRPERALATQCDARFVDAASTALLAWRFEPYRARRGGPRPVKTDVVVRFRR